MRRFDPTTRGPQDPRLGRPTRDEDLRRADHNLRSRLVEALKSARPGADEGADASDRYSAADLGDVVARSGHDRVDRRDPGTGGERWASSGRPPPGAAREALPARQRGGAEEHRAAEGHIFWETSNISSKGSGSWSGRKPHLRRDGKIHFESLLVWREPSRGSSGHLCRLDPAELQETVGSPSATGSRSRCTSAAACRVKRQPIDQSLQVRMLRAVLDVRPPQVAVLLDGRRGRLRGRPRLPLPICERMYDEGWGIEVSLLGSLLRRTPFAVVRKCRRVRPPMTSTSRSPSSRVGVAKAALAHAAQRPWYQGCPLRRQRYPAARVPRVTVVAVPTGFEAK